MRFLQHFLPFVYSTSVVFHSNSTVLFFSISIVLYLTSVVFFRDFVAVSKFSVRCQGHNRNLPLKNCITATKIETHFHNTALQCTQEHYTCAHKDTPPIQKGCTHTSISILNTHTDVSKRLHGQGLLSHEYVLLYLKMV